jgi:hypothetical protein
MYFLHEIHSLDAGACADYEDRLRDEWGPALERESGARLVWCVRTLPGTVCGSEIITLTALVDGDALERLGERIRDGDLEELALSLSADRVGLAQRVMTSLPFSEYEPDRTDGDAEHAPPVAYIHDFVPPRTGRQRPYEEAMAQVFLKTLEAGSFDFVMWAGLQTVAGGGPIPENTMITGVRSPEVLTTLLTTGNSREDFQPGAWMFEALKLRDTWISRLVRASPWSPTR